MTEENAFIKIQGADTLAKADKELDEKVKAELEVETPVDEDEIVKSNLKEFKESLFGPSGY